MTIIAVNRAGHIAAALDAAKARALDAVAEAVRQVINPEGVPDLSLIYTEKERQALAVLDAVDPDPADYDLVRRDMIVDGTTITQAAQAIVDEAGRMRAIAGPLEEWRRGRNAAIRGAATVAEVEAIDASAASLTAAIVAEQS